MPIALYRPRYGRGYPGRFTLGAPASSLRSASLTALLLGSFTRGWRARLRRAVVILAVSAGLGSGAVSIASAADPGPWTRPVPGPLVRAFTPPRTRYGAGHLGADLAAAPGTPVRAAGAGTVEFAGVVANTRHVVVRHSGGLRTSYAFLRSIAVHRGQLVARGAVLGLAGGRGENHDGRVLHLGLRAGDLFLDPMQLFAPVDLTDRVRLAPVVPAGFGPG